MRSVEIQSCSFIHVEKKKNKQFIILQTKESLPNATEQQTMFSSHVSIKSIASCARIYHWAITISTSNCSKTQPSSLMLTLTLHYFLVFSEYLDNANDAEYFGSKNQGLTAIQVNVIRETTQNNFKNNFFAFQKLFNCRLFSKDLHKINV